MGNIPSDESSAAGVSHVAIQNVVLAVHRVFGEELDASQIMYTERSESNGFVYAGSIDAPSYYGYTAQDTGAVKHVAKHFEATALTKEQKPEADTYIAMLQAGDNAEHAMSAEQREAIVTACTPIVTELIEREFANGRTVLESQNSYIWTDSEMESRLQVGTSVHMSEGECYTVTVVWPHLKITEFSFYPDGWDACIQGYHTS